MFDFAWSEIALIGVVALVFIGPKDLPVAIKAVAEAVKKARRMAGEFQTHVDEMVREANLHEVRDQFNDLRRMDIKGQILKAVDSDGSIRKTLQDNPMDFSPPPPAVPVHDAPPPATTVESMQAALSAKTAAERPQHDLMAQIPGVPAFVPPGVVATPEKVEAPAFIPPAAAGSQAEHA